MPEEVTKINAERLTLMAFVLFHSTRCLEEKRMPEEVSTFNAARLTRMAFVLLYSTGCLKEKRTPEEATMVDAARLTSMAFVLFCSTRCLEEERMPEEVTMLNAETLTGLRPSCNRPPIILPSTSSNLSLPPVLRLPNPPDNKLLPTTSLPYDHSCGRKGKAVYKNKSKPQMHRP
jgi:hypothetical protein